MGEQTVPHMGGGLLAFLRNTKKGMAGGQFGGGRLKRILLSFAEPHRLLKKADQLGKRKVKGKGARLPYLQGTAAAEDRKRQRKIEKEQVK